MKRNILLAVVLVTSAVGLRAATNDLTSLLQQGLFDEEANHDLTSAIADYQSLATQFDRDRQVAATAIYRLGECYRKLGETNEAVSEYQRIVKDFGDQRDLVTLSQQNLTGLGVVAETHFATRLAKIGRPVPTEATASAIPVPAAEEANLLATQLAGVEQFNTNGGNLILAVQSQFPDDGLRKMLLHLDALALQKDELADNLDFNLRSFVWAINPETDATPDNHFQAPTNRVDGLRMAQQEWKKQLAAIKQRVASILNLQQARLQVLQSEARNSSEFGSVAPADAESQEIARITAMLQNSPDLINGHNGELARAANAGELRVAAFLLDHGADINTKGGGEIPLIMAAQNAQKSMVELLLNRGADVNAHDASTSALLTAAKAGYQAVVEVLLEHKADPNETLSRVNWGETPLELAAEGGYANIVHLLLTAGANPNAPDDRPRTPLVPAINSGSAESVKLLLDAGADPNAVDYSGRTPVSHAAAGGSAELVKLLLAAKGDPNGGTLDAPLLCAISKQDIPLAELLLQAGANPNVLCKADGTVGGNNPMTPLYKAVSTDQLPMVQLLLKYKADPNGTQTDGRSLLFSALTDTNILQTLLVAGAEVDARDSTAARNNKPLNWTPLMIAVERNLPVEVANILLDHGANPNLTDNAYGGTPLYWSAGWGLERVPNRELVDLLLRHQADPNVRATSGRTLLDGLKLELKNAAPDKQIAINDIADLLRQHGALDYLPDWNHVTVSRSAGNILGPVFLQGTNDGNQFTVLDLLAVECQFLAFTPGDQWERAQDAATFFGKKQPLAFSNLGHIRIHRPAPDQKSIKDIAVDLGAGLNSGDCAFNLPLQWGDVVEIPEADHPLNERWTGFSMTELTNLDKCLTRHVEIIIKGQTNTISLGLGISDYGNPWHPTTTSLAQDSMTFFGPGQHMSIQKVWFWLGPVLLRSKLILASSDLSQVKVTRRDSPSGKTSVWTVDCSGIFQNQFNNPDVWLRDGDVIEVPEKQ